MIRFARAGAKAAPAAAAAAGTVAGSSQCDAPRRTPAQKQTSGPGTLGKEDEWELVNVLDDIQPTERDEAIRIAKEMIENNFELEQHSPEPEYHLEISPTRTPQGSTDSEMDDVLIIGTFHPTSIIEQAEQNIVRPSKVSLANSPATRELQFSGEFHRAVSAAMMDPECQRAFLKHVDLPGLMNQLHGGQELDLPPLNVLPPARTRASPQLREVSDNPFEDFCKEVGGHIRGLVGAVGQKVQEFLHHVRNIFNIFKGPSPDSSPVQDPNAVKVQLFEDENGEVKVSLTTYSTTEAPKPQEQEQKRTVEEEGHFLQAVMVVTFLILSIVLLGRLGVRAGVRVR